MPWMRKIQALVLADVLNELLDIGQKCSGLKYSRNRRIELFGPAFTYAPHQCSGRAGCGFINGHFQLAGLAVDHNIGVVAECQMKLAVLINTSFGAVDVGQADADFLNVVLQSVKG